MERLRTGIHPGVPEKDYHADPCIAPSLSSGIAKVLLRQSPIHAHYQHPRLGGNVPEDDPKFDIGTASHALLLEGEDRICVVDAKDWRTKAAKELRDEAREEGKIPLLTEQAVRVHAMAEAAKRQLVPFGFKGDPEQTMVWRQDGAWCRGRVDMLDQPDKVLWDFKSTAASAKPESWERTMLGMMGLVQVGMYLAGAHKVGVPEAKWRWVVQENYPPYALSVCDLTPSGLELADRQFQLALTIWKRCMETDEWPGYPTRIASIEPPAWEEAQQLSRELNDPDAVELAIQMGEPL